MTLYIGPVLVFLLAGILMGAGIWWATRPAVLGILIGPEATRSLAVASGIIALLLAATTALTLL